MRYPDIKPIWHKWYHRRPWAGPHGLRMVVLRRDPVCKKCLRYPSEIADHIIPHRGNWDLFIRLSNLQGLCKKCHDSKTATDDGGFGNKPVDPNAPTAIGKAGKDFTATAMGGDHVDKALAAVDIDKLLEGL